MVAVRRAVAGWPVAGLLALVASNLLPGAAGAGRGLAVGLLGGAFGRGFAAQIPEKLMGNLLAARLPLDPLGSAPADAPGLSAVLAIPLLSDDSVTEVLALYF
mgnify:CR=1 FL=1